MIRKLFVTAAATFLFGWAASDASAQAPFTHADVRGTVIQGWPITPPSGVIGPISPPAASRVYYYTPTYYALPTYRTYSYYDPFNQSWVTQQVYLYPNR
jgi:hypothetical protein